MREAHARNLEFHAWFNPYRVSMNTDRDALVARHPARAAPRLGGRVRRQALLQPGHARRSASSRSDAIIDAVARYDVDGVHFDDYFYPYPVAGQDVPDDDQTFADVRRRLPRHRGGPRRLAPRQHRPADRAGWTSGSTRAKPWVKFGISPFGVWRNIATDPEGSDTTAGAQTYDDLYADTRSWVREDWIDYIAPQVYWHIGFAPADYAELVPWWADQVQRHRRAALRRPGDVQGGASRRRTRPGRTRGR